MFQPPVENLPYDFIWAGFRIQEKTAYIVKESLGQYVPLARSHNTPYKYGDFDLLHIHLVGNFTRYFYEIPADSIFNNRFFQSPFNETLSVYPGYSRVPLAVHNANKWANPYLNHYDDPNLKVKLQRICQMQFRHVSIPIPKLNVWESFPCRSLIDIAIKYSLPISYPLPNEVTANYQVIIFDKRIRERNTLFNQRYEIPLFHPVDNKRIPHSPDHFDILLSYFPEPYLNLFALIPVELLKSKDLLRTDSCPGIGVIIFHMDPPRVGGYRRKHDWLRIIYLDSMMIKLWIKSGHISGEIPLGI